MSAAFCAPEFLAGLGVERDDIRVERGAEQLAVGDRRAAVDHAAADDAQRLRRILDLGLPDLVAGLGVDRDRGVVGRDVEHALVDERLRFLAAVVVKAVIPDRNQMLDIGLVDLLQRAEALQIVAHAVVDDAARIFRAVGQFVGRLRPGVAGQAKQPRCRHHRGELHLDVLPI